MKHPPNVRASLGACAVVLLSCSSDREPRATKHEIIARSVPDGRTGLKRGSFDELSLEWEPIEIEARFRHSLSFRPTPMMPPSRSAVRSFGPVILFDDALDTIVISPLDHFFVSLMSFENGRVRSGLAGEVDEVPAGFTQRWLRVDGHGIRKTVEAWGALVRADRGVPAPDRYADTGLSYLGYWTDNGAAYYYETLPGLNEEDTLLEVVRDARQKRVPFGYVQLDSWWYEKEPPDSLGSPGGLIRWEPQAGMFPRGLRSFRDGVGLPLVLHNRWFARDNAYRNAHEFEDGPRMSLPKDRAVFDELMADAKSWGAFTYEQDWLVPQYEGLPALRSVLGRAESWMQAIDDAATGAGLTTQLTMGGGAHLMDAAGRRAVTTFRTSIDYHAGAAKTGFWPQFHTVNMVASALGIWPFKDNFHTSETWGEAEALISTLSAGMVGIGDAVGDLDAAIALRTCRSDGLLLKPDRPAVPIDAMFLPHSRPYVTTTYSDRGDLGRWVYVAAYHIERGDEERRFLDDTFALLSYDGKPVEDMFVIPDRITHFAVSLSSDLELEGERVVYDFESATAKVVEESFELPRTSRPFEHSYVVVAPIFESGLALIGEPTKLVTLADKRFERIEAVDDGMELALVGAPGERVPILVYDTEQADFLPTIEVVLEEDGRGIVRVER